MMTTFSPIRFGGVLKDRADALAAAGVAQRAQQKQVAKDAIETALNSQAVQTVLNKTYFNAPSADGASLAVTGKDLLQELYDLDELMAPSSNERMSMIQSHDFLGSTSLLRNEEEVKAARQALLDFIRVGLITQNEKFGYHMPSIRPECRLDPKGKYPEELLFTKVGERALGLSVEA